MFYPNEAAGIAICIGAVLLCLVIGLILLSGHGAKLIAGFNMATKEKRDKVNKKALCRAVGSFVIAVGVIIALIIPAALYVMTWLVYSLIGLILVSAALFLIYINKSSRFLSE